MIGVGVDVGAARVHVVALNAAGRVPAASVLPADGAGEAVVEWLSSVGDVVRVAVDAPAGRSACPHAEDRSLAPKFRRARCGEIALGRDAGVWVPWVSPAVDDGPVPPWITVGFEVFAALAAAGHDAVETYPHGVFRALAPPGERIPAKSTPAGLARRGELLRAAGVVEPTLPLWGHDGLDATAAAVTAADPDARAFTCGHDDSAIWLPRQRLP